MKPLLHFLFAMNVFMLSGSARRLLFCRCLSRLAVALIVVSSYAFFFIQSITFMIVGDGVLIMIAFAGDDVKIVGDAVLLAGDDDAVPV